MQPYDLWKYKSVNVTTLNKTLYLFILLSDRTKIFILFLLTSFPGFISIAFSFSSSSSTENLLLAEKELSLLQLQLFLLFGNRRRPWFSCPLNSYSSIRFQVSLLQGSLLWRLVQFKFPVTNSQGILYISFVVWLLDWCVYPSWL